MAYLLDTNVICEATARHPDTRVLAWIEAHARELFLSSVSLGEIWKGIHRLPDGKRKRGLIRWVEGIENDFTGKTLGLDTVVMKTWGKLYANNEANGFNLDVLDSLVAATALAHDLMVATRNTQDFPSDVKTINPWTT